MLDPTSQGTMASPPQGGGGLTYAVGPVLIRDPDPLVSRDPDDAQARLSTVFSPHRLEVVSGESLMDVTLRWVRLPNLTLGELAHGAEVDVTPGRLRTYYNINTVLAGHTKTACGRDTKATAAGTAAVLSPDERSTMRWSADCRQLAVKVNRTAVERELAAIVGHTVETPLVFDLLMDTTTGLGWGWLHTVLAMIEHLNSAPVLIGNDLVVARYESLIIGQLLTAQPNNYSDELSTRGRTPVRPRRIQAVIDLIEERPGDPLTALDLAEAAQVSLRSLQDDFREHLGLSPMAYLRNVRLARAHEDLVAASGDRGVSVADIAYKWGFGHVPRFAAVYRERYGEAPSATLRA